MVHVQYIVVKVAIVVEEDSKVALRKYYLLEISTYVLMMQTLTIPMIPKKGKFRSTPNIPFIEKLGGATHI